jgi:hypothetical protein
MNTSALSGRYSNSVGGGWPGRGPRDSASSSRSPGSSPVRDHLDVVARALLQALRLEKLVIRLELGDPLLELDLDRIDGAQHDVAGSHVVRLRKDRHPRHLRGHGAGKGVEEADVLDLLVEQLDAHRLRLRLRREDVDHVAAHAVGAAAEVDIVALVLQLRELAQHLALVDHLAAGQVHDHLEIRFRVAEAVDRRHGGDHQAVLAGSAAPWWRTGASARCGR